MDDARRENIFRKANFHFHCYRSGKREGKGGEFSFCNIFFGEEESGKAFFPSIEAERKRKARGLRGKNEGYLMSNFLSYIEFYYITTRCTAATHTRNSARTKKMEEDENKRIHFAQSRIKFLLNFRTFTFIHPFSLLLSWEKRKIYRLVYRKPWDYWDFFDAFEKEILFKSNSSEETTPTLVTSKCNKIYIKNVSSSFFHSLAHFPSNHYLEMISEMPLMSDVQRH